MFAVLGLDFEATDKDPTRAHIIQVGAALRFSSANWPGTLTWSQLVATKETISQFVQTLTGIKSVEGEEELPKVLKALEVWFCAIIAKVRTKTHVRCILVTYNGTSYDLPLLAKSLHQHGSDLETWFRNMGLVGHMDMLGCVKQHDFYESYTLEAMHKQVYGKGYDAHDAANDAAATVALFFDLGLRCEHAAGIKAVLTDVERALETQNGVVRNPARREQQLAKMGAFEFHVRAV